MAAGGGERGRGREGDEQSERGEETLGHEAGESTPQARSSGTVGTVPRVNAGSSPGNELSAMPIASRYSRTAFALAASLVACSVARPARAGGAGEIQFRAIAGGEGSSWATDRGGFVGIEGGFRFIDLIAPYFLARAGYATVNQRVLELIQIGAQIWGRLGITRPYLRLGLVHQHEESWAAYQADYLGSFLGVGDGIRHRGGGEFAVGIDIPVLTHKAWQGYLSAEGLATVFPPDQKGPRVYGGGTLGIGFNYGL
jgi:hypothetical protein